MGGLGEMTSGAVGLEGQETGWSIF
jgi:hypothetical protein